MVCCFIVLGSFLLAICYAVAKIYLRMYTPWNGSYTCLVGKTAIITGANTGIGYYTALDLAKRGARVILACRSKEKAESARNRIVSITGNKNVVYKLIDMASFSSIRAFAKDINNSEERLDILVNNAGAGFLGDNISEDGIQLVMQVNHFGCFLLTNLLIGLLKKSAPSRIVTVSSVMSNWVRNFEVDKLNSYPLEIAFPEIETYSVSKLCNVLFSNELARRLEGSGVTSNSLHPGAVYTEFMRGDSYMVTLVYRTMATMFFKTPEEGAQTSIYCSVSKDVDGVTGKYFCDCQVSSPPEKAEDNLLMDHLWKKSVRLVEMEPDELQC